MKRGLFHIAFIRPLSIMRSGYLGYFGSFRLSLSQAQQLYGKQDVFVLSRPKAKSCIKKNFQEIVSIIQYIWEE
jgi:hypothetical protein